MKTKHKEIDNFKCSVHLLNENYKDYLKDFSTGHGYPEKGLGDYVKKEAFEEMRTGDGVSYIVMREITNEKLGKKKQEVIAFYTLVSSAIPIIYRTEDDDEVYEVTCGIPAVRIHMFAVKDSYQDVFYLNKPVAAWIFENIIDTINQKSKEDMGIKAIYLHSIPSAKKFYKKNKMMEAEEYMTPFSGLDDDCDVMYAFIRDVSITYEKASKKISRFVRIKRRIGKYLLK